MSVTSSLVAWTAQCTEGMRGHCQCALRSEQSARMSRKLERASPVQHACARRRAHIGTPATQEAENAGEAEAAGEKGTGAHQSSPWWQESPCKLPYHGVLCAHDDSRTSPPPPSPSSPALELVLGARRRTTPRSGRPGLVLVLGLFQVRPNVVPVCTLPSRSKQGFRLAGFKPIGSPRGAATSKVDAPLRGAPLSGANARQCGW